MVRLSVQQIDQPTWGGYALESMLSHTQFKDVKASWKVPSAHCNFFKRETSVAGFWVGLGGINVQPLEQIGTLSECSGGMPFYYAVYEMLPAQPQAMRIFRLVLAGDPITAEVKYSPPNSFMLSIKDAAPFRGWSYSKSFTQSQMNGALSSADWIVERPPTQNNLPLANFDIVNFTGCSADGMSINDGTFIDKFLMVGPNGVLASTYDLNADGASFSVKWIRSS
jgi:hypothetical protein